MQRRKLRRPGRFNAPSPTAIVLLTTAALGLAYVWLDSKCESLGREIKALECKNIELAKTHMEERSDWIEMKSPPNVRGMLAQHGIAMDWPRGDKIVRLTETDVFAKGQGVAPSSAAERALASASRRESLDDPSVHIARERIVMND